MRLCKRDACPRWAVSQRHRDPSLSLAQGWGQRTVTVGPWAAAGPPADICHGWLCRRSRGFPTSCANPGSVSHWRTLVAGADGGGELGDKGLAWDIVPYPRGEIKDLLVSLKGEAMVGGQRPPARYGRQMWGKQELSAQIQPRAHHLFEIGEELS